MPKSSSMILHAGHLYCNPVEQSHRCHQIVTSFTAATKLLHRCYFCLILGLVYTVRPSESTFLAGVYPLSALRFFLALYTAETHSSVPIKLVLLWCSMVLFSYLLTVQIQSYHINTNSYLILFIKVMLVDMYIHLSQFKQKWGNGCEISLYLGTGLEMVFMYSGREYN